MPQQHNRFDGDVAIVTGSDSGTGQALDRAAEPEVFANGIAFLASDEAASMHGSAVVADGGLMQNTGQGA